MPNISVNLYHSHSGEQFDCDHAIKHLKNAFPDIEVANGDPLLIRFENAKNAGLDPLVISKLERDAQAQGPARSFTLKLGNQGIRGVVKRQLLQLVYDNPLTERSLENLVSVIRRLHPLGTNLKVEISNESKDSRASTD